MADCVLLTGISGFIGGHVALALLDAGYAVRGGVRSLDKSAKVAAALANAGADTSRLEFVELDLLNDRNWSEAARDCRYLQHVASPLIIAAPKDRNELIRPAVEGTSRAIASALAADIERIVLTSSIAAIQYGHAGRTSPLTESDWSDLGAKTLSAYAESKTRAEREAWALMEAAGRRADLAVVNPGIVLGPLLDDDPGTSAVLVQRLLNGTIPAVPHMDLSIVDVRDVAALHLAAMTAPEAGGQRFIAVEASVSLVELVDILRAAFPERAGKLPRLQLPDWLVRLAGLFNPTIRAATAEFGAHRRFNATPAKNLLGRDFIPVSQAPIATARSLAAHHLI